jgi:outer membrane protein TolC
VKGLLLLLLFAPALALPAQDAPAPSTLTASALAAPAPAASAPQTYVPAADGSQPFDIDLKSAEAAAFQASSTLKASGFALEAAQSLGDAAFTGLFPRIALDANDRYNTHVTELSIAPGAPPVAFGTNNNYSVGIGATWTFWDSGRTYNLYKALQAGESQYREDFEGEKSLLRLRARVAYFQTQLMAERTRLMAESLQLSQSEAKDIDVRLQAGASSRIDSLSAKNEVLQRRSDYRQARADLASALRDLFALTGLGAGLDPSVPQVEGTSGNPPADTEPATLTLKLQSLESSLDELKDAESAPFNPNQPQLQSLRSAAESAHLQATALESGHWPTLAASARASYDYPDAILPDTIQQNSFAVFATWPLFAFGQVNKQVDAQLALAGGQEALVTARATDLQRDWLKSHDRLKALRDQTALDEQSVTETENLYKLIYNSYQNGSSSLLEVQTASLHALEAKISLASTETQMLIELATLSSLSE